MIGKDRKNNIFNVPYTLDEGGAGSATAIAKNSDELITQLLFSSIKNFEQDIEISEDGTQLAILIRQCKGEVPGPSFILQLEFHDPADDTVNSKASLKKNA